MTEGVKITIMPSPMETDSIPILLVEDNPRDIEIIQRSLKKGGIPNPVHTARDGQEALDLLHRDSVRPGVVILDLYLPGISGMEVLREIKRIEPETVVVVLTGQASLQTAIQSLRREKAFDYIEKSKDNLQELVDSVRLALERRAIRLQAWWLVEDGKRTHRVNIVKVQEVFGLSSRETDVVKCLCRGYTNKEIAERLFISELTVKGHLKKIYQKMGVHSRATLISRILAGSPASTLQEPPSFHGLA